MSAIDWEHAPEIAKPTYEELEAMCWELTEQNAELREHVRMPGEPLEIDEKDFYTRAFIKWAIEEQPEVKRLEAENAKLRELLCGLEVCADDNADARTDCPLYDEGEPDRCAKERIKRELGIEVDA